MKRHEARKNRWMQKRRKRVGEKGNYIVEKPNPNPKLNPNLSKRNLHESNLNSNPNPNLHRRRTMGRIKMMELALALPVWVDNFEKWKIEMEKKKRGEIVCKKILAKMLKA